VLGLAFSLAAQLEFQGHERIGPPSRDGWSGLWEEFAETVSGAVGYDVEFDSADRARQVMLLAALSADPSLCPAKIGAPLGDHPVARLAATIFGEGAPAPVALLFFSLPQAWDYLCESASLQGVVGGAVLLRGSTCLAHPLGELARHCHLRAGEEDTFLTAAGLINDCLVCASCTGGIVLVPAAAADGLRDAIARFVVSATLSACPSCFTLPVSPTEIAFGFKANEIWFDQFLADAQRTDPNLWRKLGFETAGTDDRDALWASFVGSKAFSQLLELAHLFAATSNPGWFGGNRYESEALIKPCQECWRRPASSVTDSGLPICEPCQWRVSSGAKFIRKNLGPQAPSWITKGQRDLGVVIISAEPTEVALASKLSLSSWLEAIRGLCRTVSSSLDALQRSLDGECLICPLSDTQAMIIIPHHSLHRAKRALLLSLATSRRDDAHGVVRHIKLGFSTTRAAVPVALLINEAVRDALEPGRGELSV